MSAAKSTAPNGRRGRKPQTFVKEAASAAERRRQQRALASVHAVAEKLASLRHMVELAEHERNRVILRAAEAGVAAAEMARILGVSDARVSQWRKEARPVEGEGEGDE